MWDFLVYFESHKSSREVRKKRKGEGREEGWGREGEGREGRGEKGREE